jgi:GNAT superfamily N-acetyltransferase
MDLREIFACSACGVPMDWTQARLRVTCGCDRGGALAADLSLRRADEGDGAALQALCMRFFHHTDLIAWGQKYEIAECENLVAERNGRLVGLLSYVYQDDCCLVVAFAVGGGEQGRGVGAKLQGLLEGECRGRKIWKMVLSTTNDNLPALYFYQRHGFRISEVLPGAVADTLRELLGGEVPEGFGGIPVTDEIRLKKELSREGSA